MLQREAVEREEEAIREAVRQLPDAQRARFHHQFSRRYRDPDTYAVLNWLFVAGLHHFYLGQPVRGVVNLLIFAAGVALCFTGLWPKGVALILGISLVELPALFRSQLIVQHHNNRLMRQLLAELQGEPPAPPA